MNRNTPIFDRGPLLLPENHVKRRIKLMKWFRDTDSKLADFVLAGTLKLEMAQTYFRMKVEGDPFLAKADKQTLANESRVWKIPNPNLA